MIQTDFNIDNAPHRRFQLTKRTVFISIAVVVIVAVLVVTLFGLSLSRQAGKVASAVRASFPDFCREGQILTEVDTLALLPPGQYWGVRCDSWLQGGGAFYGYATIVDAEKCMTMRPLVGTDGTYYSEMEALNSSNGKKMAVCP